MPSTPLSFSLIFHCVIPHIVNLQISTDPISQTLSSNVGVRDHIVVTHPPQALTVINVATTFLYILLNPNTVNMVRKVNNSWRCKQWLVQRSNDQSQTSSRDSTRYVSCSIILVILLNISLRLLSMLFCSPFAWSLFIRLPRVKHNRTLSPSRHPRPLPIVPNLVIKSSESFFNCFEISFHLTVIPPAQSTIHLPTNFSFPPILYSHITILNETFVHHRNISTSLVLHSIIMVSNILSIRVYFGSMYFMAYLSPLGLGKYNDYVKKG